MRIAPKIIAGIVVVIVIGAGSLLVIWFWDPFWSPFRPSPNEVLKETLTNFEELKTFHFNVSFKKEIKRLQQKAIENSMTVSGDLDNTIKENLKWKGETTIENSFPKGLFSLSWEKIIIGENSWFRLISPPSSQFSDIFTFDLEKIKDLWIKLGESSFENLFGKFSAPLEMEVIKKIAANERLFQFKKVLPDEKTNGEETYHYLFGLKKEDFSELVPEISELLPIETEELKKFKEIEAEVWIGKKDKLPYKIKLEGKINPQGSEEIITITSNIRLSKFNAHFKIELPQEFKLFEDVFGTEKFDFFSFPR